MSAEKLAEALRRIKSNLMHQRRFGVYDLWHWRRAAVQAEGDIEEALAAHEAEQEQAGEAVAWRWEHYHTTTGVVVGRGLSDTKVQPTQHAMLAGHDFDNGWIGTRVQPLYTRPQQPLSDEQIDALIVADATARGRIASGRDEIAGLIVAAMAAIGITKDTKDSKANA